MAWLLVLVWASLAAANFTINDKLRDDADLSEFYSRLDRNQGANYSLQFRGATVFAPLNAAFQKYSGITDNDDIVLYHITNTANTLSQLGNFIPSELDGNPPLWVTRTQDHIFINNAKVVRHRSDFTRSNKMGKRQVLHVLEEVLEPIQVRTPSENQYNNPNAYEFMNMSENVANIGDHRIRGFRSRVTSQNKQDVFSTAGQFTFFIPVDEGFQPPPRPEKIDMKVIDGHVVPNEVLFTSATPDGQEYKTLAFTDMLKVTVSFTTEVAENTIKRYIKSHTVVGDSTHPVGVVIAEIVKANIPVRNGVVHLIHRPLMVVDSTVNQFLESFKNSLDGPLYRFYEVIRDTGGDFMDRLTKRRELTLFAPTNAAWNEPTVLNYIRDRNKMNEVLNLHLVNEKLTQEQIIYNNRHQLFQVPTTVPHKNIYFNVVLRGGNKTLTMEGGGVNATIIQPDIAATNGIVHIIDRVLGIPYVTVGRKLATDPMLNKTYIMGSTQGFNDQLDDERKRFTYFVPRDYAWNKLETKFPSAHKKLFMKDFAYHAKQILERHLVIADRSYSMAELKNMTQHEAMQLPTVRDILKLRVKDSEQRYFVEWNNEWIHVFRSDVECTNGVIHVIDKVLIRESDVQVSGGSIILTLHSTIGFLVCLAISQYL